MLSLFYDCRFVAIVGDTPPELEKVFETDQKSLVRLYYFAPINLSKCSEFSTEAILVRLVTSCRVSSRKISTFCDSSVKFDISFRRLRSLNSTNL